MAGINRTTGKATDLITFSRASGGTALRKISYGSELVTNGGFDTDTTGWASVAGAILSFVSGSLEVTSTAGGQGASQLIATQTGKVYKVTFDNGGGTASTVSFRVSSGGLLTGDLLNIQSGLLSGTNTATFVATSNSATIYLRNGSAGTQVWDNISVKEVLLDQPDGTLTLFNHPTNIPRIEYDAAGNVNGLLIEEARTNVVTYSEDFTNAAWLMERVTVSGDVVSAPSGAMTADKVIEDATTNSHRIRQNISVTAVPYSFSVFAKAAERSKIRLFAGGVNASADFDLATGESSNEVGAASQITQISNGWYHCSISFTQTSAASTLHLVAILNDSGDFSYAGDGTSGIYIYGAQLEAGSFPTSYIPTSGATATRAADIASISVDNFGYNQKAGTVVVEANLSNLGNSGSGSEGIASFVANANIENIGLFKRGGAAASEVLYEVRSSNIKQATIGLVASVSNVKVSYSFAKDKFNLALDGSLGAEDTSGSVPVGVTDLSLGNIYSVSGIFVLNGHIKSLSYFPRRLTNAQLQSLTE